MINFGLELSKLGFISSKCITIIVNIDVFELISPFLKLSYYLLSD
jgi:hypothetical protein